MDTVWTMAPVQALRRIPEQGALWCEKCNPQVPGMGDGNYGETNGTHTHIYMIINGPWWLTSGVFIQQPHGKLTSSTNGDTTQHSPHSSWSPRIRSCWKKNPWWYTKCSIKLAPLRIITLPFTKVFLHLLVKLFTLFVRCQSFSTKEKSTSEKWSKLTGFPGLPTRHDGPVWPKATKFFQHGSGHMTVPKKG